MSEPTGEGWITTQEAQVLTGYVTVYLRLLIDRGRIVACKVGHGWLIDRESLLRYKAHVDANDSRRSQ